MKVKLARSLSKQIASEHGLDHEDAIEGATISVSDDSAKALSAAKLLHEIKAIPSEPEILAEGSVEKATADLKDYQKKAKREAAQA
jgi:hypothetical protein